MMHTNSYGETESTPHDAHPHTYIHICKDTWTCHVAARQSPRLLLCTYVCVVTARQSPRLILCMTSATYMFTCVYTCVYTFTHMHTNHGYNADNDNSGLHRSGRRRSAPLAPRCRQRLTHTPDKQTIKRGRTHASARMHLINSTAMCLKDVRKATQMQQSRTS